MNKNLNKAQKITKQYLYEIIIIPFDTVSHKAVWSKCTTDGMSNADQLILLNFYFESVAAVAKPCISNISTPIEANEQHPRLANTAAAATTTNTHKAPMNSRLHMFTRIEKLLNTDSICHRSFVHLLEEFVVYVARISVCLYVFVCTPCEQMCTSVSYCCWLHATSFIVCACNYSM